MYKTVMKQKYCFENMLSHISRLCRTTDKIQMSSEYHKFCYRFYQRQFQTYITLVNIIPDFHRKLVF